jgi:phospholipid/cholesterol/gamma-HCH transport system substrate-binding protein
VATRTQKAKVGLFLLICLGLMAAGLALLTGRLEDRGNHYWILFDQSIAGLYEGGMVQYRGVPVGKVRSIRVMPQTNQPHVEIVLDPEKVTLYDGVEAQIVFYSLAAGTMAISLEGGDLSRPPLKPNSQIPAKRSPLDAISNNIEGIMSQMTEILDALTEGVKGMQEGDIKKLVDNANGLLEDGRQFLTDGREILNKAKTTVDDVKAQVQRVVDEFTEISDRAKPLISDVNKFVVTAEDKLAKLDAQKLNDELGKVLERFAQLTESANKVMDQFDTLSASTLHEADNLEHSLRTALDSMTEALYVMRTFVEQLQQDPASLVRGKGRLREAE